MTRTLAIDIETVPLGSTADFADPTSWEVFAVGIGHRIAPDVPIETAVLVREGDTDHDERRLLARVINWARKREPHDCLLTFNGESFDLPVLAARADALLKSDRPHEQSLSFALYSALDISHRDLLEELKGRQPAERKWPSLDEALAERDIHATPAVLDGEELTGAAMPSLGRRVLAGEATPDERAALETYCTADIRPLFALADQLTGERTERIEAEARAAVGQSATNTESDR